MKKCILFLVIMLMVVTLFTSCAESAKPAATTAPSATTAGTKAPDATTVAGMAIKGTKPKIGYAQSRMNHPYRVAAMDQLKAAVAKGKYDWEIVITDANNDPNKQTADIEDLIAQDCDIICMTPITSEALVPACQKVRAAGIPLILVDRYIVTEDYDYYVGGDNVEVGRIVGRKIAELANSSNVNVLEFQITAGSSAAIDRDKGFMEILGQNPNIKCLAVFDHESMRDKAMKAAEDAIIAYDDLFAIYSQNDEGALGILAACQGAGVPTSATPGEGILIFGTDGQKELFDQIKAGTIAGTVIFPTGTPEVVDVIAKLLAGEKVDRITRPQIRFVDKSNVDELYNLGI
ncbi:MAG: substrate-binding domain-containing protein [Christensenellales bacterium]